MVSTPAQRGTTSTTNIFSSSVGTFSGTVNAPSGTADGDVLVLAVNGGTNATQTITVPATWTLIGTSQTLSIYQRTWHTGDPTSYTVTVTRSGSPAFTGVLVSLSGFSGVDPVTPVDATPVSQIKSAAANAAVTLGPVDVASASNALIVAYWPSSDSSGTVTANDCTAGDQTVGARFWTKAYVGNWGRGVGTLSVTASYTTFPANAGAVVFVLRPLGAVVATFAPTSATKAPVPAIPGENVLNSAGQVVPVRSRLRITQTHTGLHQGVSVLSRCKIPSATLTTDQLSTRRFHVVTADAVDLRFEFAGFAGQDAGIGNDCTLQLLLEMFPTGSPNYAAAGQTFIVTFAEGSSTGALRDGALLRSDPLPVRLRAGDIVASDTLVRPSVLGAGGKVPINTGAVGNNEFVDTTTTSQGVILAGTSYTNGFSPTAVIGTPVGRTGFANVLLAGDSILFGASRAPAWSWAEQALELARIPHYSIAASGEQLLQFANNSGGANRDAGRRKRGVLMAGCTDVLSNYLINDLRTGSPSLATVQGRDVYWGRLVGDYGARYHRTTITPEASSTDAFTTISNQTPAAYAPTKNAFNAWLRDGAPTDLADNPLAAGVAAGAGVIRTGDPRHYITGGVVDVAAAVEVDKGSGSIVWQPGAMTTDGLHPGDSGHNRMAQVLITYAANHFVPAA